MVVWHFVMRMEQTGQICSDTIQRRFHREVHKVLRKTVNGGSTTTSRREINDGLSESYNDQQARTYMWTNQGGK